MAYGRLSWRNWVSLALGGLGIVIGGLVGANVVIDPYGVLQTSKLSNGSLTNERYLKADYLLQHPDKYNAFIVGSSTAGLIRPETMSRLDPDHRYYNLAFLAGKPKEVMLTLQMLRKHGVEIKTIVMPLDLFQFREPVVLGGEPSKNLHPWVFEHNRTAFKAKYLVEGNIWHMATKVDEVQSKMPNYRLHLTDGGNYELPKMEAERRDDPGAYIKSRFGKPVQESKTLLLDENFRDFAQLVAWCREQGVDANFFMSPVNPETRRAFGNELYQLLLQRLRQIEPGIHDYSSGFSLADFYDRSHYLSEIADQVLNDLWKHKRDYAACQGRIGDAVPIFHRQGSNCHGGNTSAWEKQG